MEKPKKLDPDKLKPGDLFRGKYWRYGENHVFKEITTGGQEQKLVVSLCNYWFYADHIHEPRTDGDRLCRICYNRKNK